MGVTKEFIEHHFPLHKLVWENKVSELETKLAEADFKVADYVEQLDPRGRTPLLLAVVLGHKAVAHALLRNNASAQFEHTSGWNILHEATCRADPELIKLILEYKDAQKQSKRSNMVPDLLRRLADAPDFYVEIKFELSSWMPFVGSVVPGNVHRVYKMGSKVRVDTCVLEDNTVDWTKAVTLIFQGLGDSVRMLEIYHATQQVFSNVILSGNQGETFVADNRVYEKTISHRLSHPAMIAYVDLDKIAFERNKTVWGWGSDKTEVVNNYECKVFSATNVHFVTKLRTEHLSESDKSEATNATKSHLHKIVHSFGTTETSELTEGATAAALGASSSSQSEITAAQYFDKDYDLKGRDIGRSKEVRTKINKFKAHVWLCEDYPVNLQEQIMPIIDIMALSNTMFSKLKQFIQMQIPAGFPVKTEIPLFHVVNGRVTFHNIFATEQNIPGVSQIQEENGKLACVLEDDLFEPPPQYHIKTVAHPGPINTSDDDLFSWTLPDEDSDVSGREHGKMVDIYEALNAPRTLMKDITPDSDTEEQLLQRAIEESLMMARMQENPGWTPSTERVNVMERGAGPEIAGAGAIGRSNSFEELQAALALSRRQIEEDDRLREEEEEALRRVLELSLKEK